MKLLNLNLLTTQKIEINHNILFESSDSTLMVVIVCNWKSPITYWLFTLFVVFVSRSTFILIRVVVFLFFFFTLVISRIFWISLSNYMSWDWIIKHIQRKGSKLPTTMFIVSIRPCIPKVFSNWTRDEMDIYDLRAFITTPR